MDFGAKMPGDRHCPRIDTLELKNHIERRLGQQKSEKYFNLLNRYLSGRFSKSEFDKLCIALVGRDNLSLHNELITAIIKNACSAKSPLPKEGKLQSSLNIKVPNGYHSNLQSLCRGVFPQSPRKGRTPTIRDRRSKDRPSPLGPYGKPRNVSSVDAVLKVPEQQSATEIVSLGSRPPFEVTSMEEGEEVEQASRSPGIYSRSPVKAPFGVSLRSITQSKAFLDLDTCYNNGELPDSDSLRKRLEQKLGTEGLAVSTDCVNLLNNGLDVFMKRLIRPCLDLAASRSSVNGIRPLISITDFQVATQSNPKLLGMDWPVQLEKVSLRASGDYMDG